MTQPQQPERPRDPAQNPFEERWRSLAFGLSPIKPVEEPAPELQRAPAFDDPFDKLANRLVERALYVRREAFVDGFTWKVVAQDPHWPYGEVRVNLGVEAKTERRGSLMVIEVRSQALRSDCERAADQAEECIQSLRRPGWRPE